MVGLLGKRSQNLLASISDKKGSRTEFTYTFNMSGYVETITATHFFEGIKTRRNKCILSFIKAFEVENPHLFQRLRSNFQLSGPIFFSDNGYSDQI